MNIINLTPHEITVVRDGETLRIPPTAPAARVAVRHTEIARVDDIPVNLAEYGAIENLSPPQPDTVYIVSIVVALAARRPDVLSPDTGPTAIRDEANRVVAVRGFVAQSRS